VEVTRHFSPEPAAVPAARHWAAARVQAWRASPDAEEAVASIVTELASNAVRHARTPFRVVLIKLRHSVRVEVHDESRESNGVMRPAPEATAGRGLGMVDRLADSAGLEITGFGKTVWAEVAD